MGYVPRRAESGCSPAQIRVLRTTIRYQAGSFTGELELLVESGLSPMEAPQNATRNPARFLGELPRNGTVVEGKTANLVLLSANPLQGIRNAGRIDSVVLRGKLLTRGDLDQLLDEVTTKRQLGPKTRRSLLSLTRKISDDGKKMVMSAMCWLPRKGLADFCVRKSQQGEPVLHSCQLTGPECGRGSSGSSFWQSSRGRNWGRARLSPPGLGSRPDLASLHRIALPSQETEGGRCHEAGG